MSGQTRICVQKLSNKDQEIFDQIHQGPSQLSKQKLAAAFFTAKLWKPGDVITCKFVGDVDPPRTPTNVLAAHAKNPSRMDPLQDELLHTPIKEAVKRVVKERIEPYVNLTFKFVDKNEKAYVRIGFENDGAWSLVGTDHKTSDKKITMNLGWFDVPTTIHEFGHVLGMIHEHQNPEGGIQWNDSKVYAWAEDTQGWDKEITYNNIIKKYEHDAINGSQYDPCSIMLYFFPPDLTTNSKGTAQNICLSGTDTEWLSHMYNNHANINDLYQKMYSRTLSQDKKDCPLGYGGTIWDNILNIPQIVFDKVRDNWIWVVLFLVIILVVVFGFILYRRKKSGSRYGR